MDLGTEDFRCRLRREPLGVVALVTPWNYPLLMVAWKVAPALAAGNCAVVKPSEVASLTSLELAALAAEAGLPRGVLNVVTGTGPDAGAPLWCGGGRAGRRLLLGGRRLLLLGMLPGMLGAHGVAERHTTHWRLAPYNPDSPAS